MRRLRSLAALAAVAVISAGCSNAAGGDAAVGDKPMNFAECMRENGVRDFPDPNASDQEFVDAIKKLDQSSATWKKAIGACKDLQPPGLLGAKASPQQMTQRLAFARCMRENGVADFPDPEGDGPLIDTTRIPSAGGKGARSIPGFQAAIDKCRDAFTHALGDR
jgi:hypothetical protein